MSIIFKRRANASTGLALEFTLQETEWDTPIHVGLLHVRVHVEKSYQSTHVECLRDNIECYRGILATSVGRYFVTYFCVCYPLLTTLRFILFSFQFPLDVQFTHICPSNLVPIVEFMPSIIAVSIQMSDKVSFE